MTPSSRGDRRSNCGGGFSKALSNLTRKHKKINPKNKQNTNKTNNNLFFTQINLQKKRNAWNTLLTNIQGKANPIILATEPYIDKNNFIPSIHKNLTPFYCKKPGSKTRAAILVHKTLENNCWELQQFTTPDQITLKIRLDSRVYLITSSYMDITKQIPPPDLTAVVNYADKHKLPLIVGSDTNARHKLWGNGECNNRGEELLNYISSNDLSWANKGTTPTFINSRGHNSIIDLTITNNLGCDEISGWNVSNSPSNSDHQYIMFDIQSKTKSKPKQFRLTKNTDWELFHEHLTENLNTELTDINTTQDLDRACAKLNDHLINAFNHACPVTYITNSIKKPPWLTSEIQSAQKTIRRKLMVARSSKTEESWRDLRDSNKSYNKLLRNTKQTEWRKFCASIESVKDSARMSNILKNISDKKEKLESVYNTNNILTDNPTDTLNTMIDNHFKDDLNSPHDYNITHTTPSNLLMNKIYDSHRIDKAVADFAPDKAAGPDGIRPIILQKAWPLIRDTIRILMIRSHELQHIPAPQTEYKGIFIPKPGKLDYNHPKAYRTITLSPILLKLQERVILWHMQYDLGMSDSLSAKQYGFRRGTSTETALHKVINIIESRIAKKGYVLGTFLDIEGAFDNVSFDAISKTIQNSPVDKSTAGWIMSMVTNRNITINHKDVDKRFRVRRGCPQGGILSPFLWNLVVDDLLKSSARDTPGHLQAFADDLVILAEGNDTDIIWQRTQHTIKTIENWCESKGLSISALKTKTIMFTWNRKWSIRPIVVGGETIELSDSVKFLGVTLDNKLNFNIHIDNITNKAIATLMQCKRAVGPMWGLSPNTCNWIYKTIVRPTLSYSSVVWIRTLNNKQNIKKLNRVQALALRIVTGAMPSTPHSALNYLTDTLNIDCYLKGEAAKGAARLQGYFDWTAVVAPFGKGIITSHTTISNTFLSDLGLPKSARKDLTKPTLILDKNYNITFPNQEEIQKYRTSINSNIIQPSSGAIACFTDGSKTCEGTGGGFITLFKNTHNDETIRYAFKLPNYCSVFQAELTALTEGAKSLLNYKNTDITFWTDSLSSLQALSSKLINSNTVASCHKTLEELATSNTVHVKWIAAHSGHWGNEQADTLAKQGTNCDNVLTGFIPQSLIKHKINQKVKKLNMEAWNSSPHKHTQAILGQKHKEIITSLNNNLSKSRILYRQAIQLITGHIGLNKHLFTLTLSTTDICPNCELEVETVDHFLSSCPSFSQLRADYFNAFYNTTTEIFDNFDITHIVKYVTKTKRLKIPENTDQSGVT